MSENTAIQTHPWITADHRTRLAVVYIRQSTEEQVRENTGSTEFQRSLAEIARSYDWPDSQIEIIDEDLGKSGSSTEGRTGWERMQEMIEADRVGAVFVANISRLSRQVLDFEWFRVRAELHKTLLYFDGRFVNPADSNDTIISQVTAMVAQYENRKRAEISLNSRLAKAQRGEVVSRLPVGWKEGPAEGYYYYDPETEQAIRLIIQTFWQTRSIRQTVIALAKTSVQIPCRKKEGKLFWAKPTTSRVTFILTHPAYTGTYVFAKTQLQPGGSVRGRSKRIKLPQERWIRHVGHHPPYMTVEEQEQIKAILAQNQFERWYRAGRGPALTQGILRCALCGASLMVTYTKRGYYFVCRRSREYAEKACLSFCCNDLDERILREVFKVLQAPPIDMIRAALEQSRSKIQTRLQWVESERERLAHEERLADERAKLAQESFPLVQRAALAKLEKILKEKEEFEEKIAFENKIAFEEAARAKHASEDELAELCRIAADVPALFQHELVTHQEKKQIVRCLIDHIVVTADNERIEATIVWKSRAKTAVFVWRARSRHHLIRELHTQQLTASEIKERLAAGKTSTGQSINMSVGGIQLSLRKMGLSAAKHTASHLAVRRKAAELDREGKSLELIARYFNDQGFKSPSGKPWTHFMVEHLIRANGQKQESLENIHRRAITEAHARGLDYSQMAAEFNQKNIRRRGGLPWTAKSIAVRWSDLERIQRGREAEKTNRDL
jgi:DNA invertase Pin-like site-specific DNA recombinase